MGHNRGQFPQRLSAALIDAGWRVSKNTVAALHDGKRGSPMITADLMAEQGLAGVGARLPPVPAAGAPRTWSSARSRLAG